MLLRKDDHILFYGDSITDAGRRNERQYNNYGLGVGYPAIIAATLAARFPELCLKFTNRGISGNRARDLERRLEDDVIGLAPTLVSIMIGVNDTWRRYDSNDPTPIAEFQDCCRRIMRRIVDKLGARLVVLEPFLLDFSEKIPPMREDLNPRIDSIRRVAREFGATYVPLDGMFAAACCRAPVGAWTDDGVHPLPPGHGLIAGAWIDAVTR